MNGKTIINQVKIEDFEIDTKDGISRRIAKCLHWYAEKAPGRAVKLPELYKVIHQKSRRPNEDSKEVQVLKRDVYRANNILSTEFNMHVKYITGVGVRATFNDDDKLSVYESRNRRVVKAIRLRNATGETIDPKKISDAARKRWFEEQQQSSARLDAAIKRLALPMPSEE